MLILYQRHNEHLKNDNCSYLEIVSTLSFLFYPTLERYPHTSPKEVVLAWVFSCSSTSFLFHLELVEDSQGPFPLRHPAPTCINGQTNNPFHSDWEYIYFNICIEDMNVAEETLEVNMGSAILISYIISHPDRDSFI